MVEGGDAGSRVDEHAAVPVGGGDPCGIEFVESCGGDRVFVVDQFRVLEIVGACLVDGVPGGVGLWAAGAPGCGSDFDKYGVGVVFW